MNKKEQKEQIAYTESVKLRLKDRGVKIGYLLTCIGISRSHWQFIKKGERPLTTDNKNKIDDFLNS